MKKIFLSFSLIMLHSVINYAQIINFPDINLRNRLLSPNIAYAVYEYLTPISSPNLLIDANSDGEITQNEALAVVWLNLGGNNISNLSGLEYFVNLKYLVVGGGNPIAVLNLTPLVNLQFLSTYQNQITSLNFSTLSDLRAVYCGQNPISYLDFSNNPLLEKVHCPFANLSTLDFTNNPMFNELDCRNNPNLASIKIKNNRLQKFGNQTVYNECWLGNPNLNYICADSFEIATLQNYLASCNITQPITINSNCVLSTNDNNINQLSLHPNPTNGIFTIDLSNQETQFDYLEMYDVLGKMVLQQKLNPLSLNQIDINFLNKGCFFAKISNEQKTIYTKIIKN